MSTALDAAADFDAFIDIDGSGAPDSPLPQPAGDTPKLLSRTAAGRPQHGRRPTPLSMSALPAHLTAGSDAHSPAFHGNGMASPMNAPSSPSVGDMFTFASAAGTPTTHSASLHSLSFDFFDGAALPGSVPFAGAPAHLSREGAADAHARQPAGPVQEVYAASYEHVPSPLAWNVSNTAATPEQHRAASAFSAAAANRAAGRGAEAVHAGAENEQLAFGAPYASPNKMLDPNGYGMPFMPFSQHDASMGMHGVGPFQQHHNYAAFAHGPPQGHAVPGAAHPSFAGGDEGPSPFTEDRSSPGSSTAPTSTERHSPPPPEKRRRLTVSDAPPPQQPVHDEESTAKALAAAVAAAAPAPPAKKAARKASKRKTKAEKNAEAAAAKAAADEAPAKRDSIVSIEASAAASNAGDAASEAANGDRDDVESVTSASQSGKRAPPSASHVTENGQPFPVIDTSAKHSSLFVPPDTSGLTKREARLVKNRAAAFLSRQRKREQFEELESRCRAICRLVWRMWEVVAGPDMSWDMFGQTILPQLLQDEAPEVREALEMIVAGKGASIAPTEESIAQNSSSGGTQRSTVSPAKQTVKRERDEDFDDSFASVASSRAVHSSHGRNSSLSSSSGNSSASTACTSVNQDAQQEPQQHQPRDKSDASAKAAQQSAPPHSPHDERPFRSGASASETGVSLTLGPEPEGKQEGGAEGSGAAVLPAEGAGSAVQATAASAKMQRSSSGRGAMQRTASGLQKRSAGGMALMVMLFGFAFLGLPAGASSGGLERAPESSAFNMGPVLAPFAQQTTSPDGLLCSISSKDDEEEASESSERPAASSAIDILAASSHSSAAADEMNIDDLLDLHHTKSTAQSEGDVEATLVDMAAKPRGSGPIGDFRGMSLGALGAHLGRHGLDVEQGFMLMGPGAPAAADAEAPDAGQQAPAALRLTLYMPTARATEEQARQPAQHASTPTSSASPKLPLELQRSLARSATIDALRAQGKDARSILDAATSEHRPQPSPSASQPARELPSAAPGAEFLELELGLAGGASASAAHVAQLLLAGARAAARSSA